MTKYDCILIAVLLIVFFAIGSTGFTLKEKSYSSTVSFYDFSKAGYWGENVISSFERLAFIPRTLSKLLYKVVGRDAVEVTHIFGLGTFLLGKKCFVHLLSVTDADDLDVFFLASEEFAYGLCLSLDGAGRSFLYKDISVLSVLKCKEDKIDCFFETHNEACHLWLGEGDWVAVANLVNPERDDRTTRAHDITITCTADLCLSAVSALCNCDTLFQRL